MILEVAMLHVRPADRSDNLERLAAFAATNDGFELARVDLRLRGQRCLEVPDKYVLLVRWSSLADHEQGFRGSPQYQEWKRLLHHFYDPFPVVEHFEPVGPPAPA